MLLTWIQRHFEQLTTTNQQGFLPLVKGPRIKTPEWMPWVLCDAETTGEPQWRLML